MATLQPYNKCLMTISDVKLAYNMFRWTSVILVVIYCETLEKGIFFPKTENWI